ncbi:MAG: metal-dependent hydrolase [Pseudomonadota bacterium]|nr:metal-dependent hydrolase [Pseudomonadota bacterium]
MDSLSQIVLGGAVAAAIAPPAHRRAALLAGAALGTLPDLDGLVITRFTSDPIALMTLHRGASHSLFVLPFVAWFIWWAFRQRGGRVAQAPRRWLWAIMTVLITHPLLDAFTSYGTQLFWPLPVQPTWWSTVFIIDPLYTVWLLLACIVAWLARERRLAQRVLVAGLVVSTAYLGWSVLAKGMVERAAAATLATMGLADAPRFSVATPFNTLLYRVVVMTPDGYLIGDRSVVADHGPMRFAPHVTDVAALQAAEHLPAVRRLTWFNGGFMRARQQGDVLVLSDLRMGLEPAYSFNFAVARRQGGTWQAMPPARAAVGEGAALSREGIGAAWRQVWQRMWRQPE